MPLDLSLDKRTHPIVLRSVEGVDRVLTPEALSFLGALDATFGEQRRALLQAREQRQKGYDTGLLPEFLIETQDIRQADWQAAPVPKVLQDRRVEITGPVDRKMMINAFNSGAKVFMADFEDATAPRFDLMIAGQVNMLDYRDKCLSFSDPKSGKEYDIGENAATLIVRPRGLHLEEANILIAGRAAPAGFFDFAIHAFHNAKALHETGRGPFYYIPKLENHREARLWADILRWTEEQLSLPKGTIKVTVLIETFRAAFEMDEIIWELRDNIAGLNCGRWDYIFSYLKTVRAHSNYVLPDRTSVTMDRAFLAGYAAQLVKVCHRRGIHAMGGMAAQIPVKNDPEANEAALNKVRNDKLREVELGHDGTWVAHPALVPVAMDVFDRKMPGANQIKQPRQYYRTEAENLFEAHKGEITEAGLLDNIQVALEYLSNWICGRGAVPIKNLMEDAATAEISRMQLWQWRRHQCLVTCETGESRVFDADWLGELMQQETVRILDALGTGGFHRGHYASAMRILMDAITAQTPPDFITQPAYEVLNALD